jgi:hypothetical protein
MKRLLAVSLLWMSSLSVADVFLECEYNDPKIRYVDYIHLFKEKEKNGLRYFSKGTFKRSGITDQIKISFKPRCGLMNPSCALATEEMYTFLMAYTLDRKTLILTDRLVVGGELPKTTKCTSIPQEDWDRNQENKNQEKNLI